VDLIRAEEPTKIFAIWSWNYGKDWHSTWTGLLMRRLPTWGYNTMAVGSSRKRASKMPLS
jgi:hypothetical protein